MSFKVAQKVPHNFGSSCKKISIKELSKTPNLVTLAEIVFRDSFHDEDVVW